ncbi:MAG: helicase HerA-like domain-containing protein, partial [Leifsonia sp.]
MSDDAVQKARAAAAAAAEEAERLQAVAQDAIRKAEEAEAAAQAAADAEAATAEPAPAAASAAPSAPVDAAATGPLDAEQVDAIRSGYAIAGAALEMGALVNGDPLADVQVRIPLAMMNRHGLVAGATGTGKTRT